MKEISFDSGLISYSLNGKLEVSFNPADPVFVERLYGGIDKMGDIQDAYANKADELKDPTEVFSVARQRDSEIGEVMDGVFGAPVCDAVFGNMSPCAFANGFPVWLNLMLSIVDEVESSAVEIQKQADPRIAKLKAKYQKYHK